MKYLLDTNICIYIIKKSPVEVINKLKKLDLSDIGISSITLSELNYGLEKSSKPIQNRLALNQFLAPLEIYPYDKQAAFFYGKIRNELEKKRQIIGPLDLLIAAHCLALKCSLVTNNQKEFQRIDRLTVENWL